MGAAVGALLVERGHEVQWLPDGRSEETARRASAAGLVGVRSFGEDVQAILSICPPHAAEDIARSLAGTSALVIDANAVSPDTATRIGELIGQRWADGGIVGPPPRRPGTTRLFLSGPHATQAASLFAGTPLQTIILEGSPVAASALKMAYASWTKGSAALLLAARASARETGVEEALLAEWARSQPELDSRWQRAEDSVVAKGWRWTGEMREIAATYAAAGLPPGFHEAAAEIFARFPRPEEPASE
jgi:3-hydroxyisobutyrate dehydrogenase-like beta-hydroxyacid dehydrogenase